MHRFVGEYERLCDEDDADRALRRSRDEAQRAADRARAALETAETATKGKSAFMATMSRELCGPLDSIKLMAQTLRRDVVVNKSNDGAKDGSKIEDISYLASQLRDVVGDVLELSRIEAGEAALIEEDLSLDAVIAASVDGVGALALAKNVTISFFPTATRIRSDGKRLRRILDDLLMRALRSTPPGDTIAIELFQEREGGLMLSIIDHGSGMAPDEVAQAMQPIEVYATDDRSPGARQFGLALIKAFIELQGGRFFIESVQGQGTAACIYLPPRSARPRA